MVAALVAAVAEAVAALVAAVAAALTSAFSKCKYKRHVKNIEHQEAHYTRTFSARPCIKNRPSGIFSPCGRSSISKGPVKNKARHPRLFYGRVRPRHRRSTDGRTHLEAAGCFLPKSAGYAFTLFLLRARESRAVLACKWMERIKGSNRNTNAVH